MQVFLLLLVLVLNAGIATLNAYAVGRVWRLAKGIATTTLLVCGLIQSVVGYSSVVMVLLGCGAYGFGWLDVEHVEKAFSLWYLLVIFPALMTGMIIWLFSVLEALSNPTPWNVLTAGWNTYAMVHNVNSAFEAVPKASDDAGSLLGGLVGGSSRQDAEATLTVVVIALVAAALFISVVMTWMVFAAGNSTTKWEMARS